MLSQSVTLSQLLIAQSWGRDITPCPVFHFLYRFRFTNSSSMLSDVVMILALA